MRLTPAEIEAIRVAVREVFGETAGVRVFGSRARDDLKGGDLDLLVEVTAWGGLDRQRATAPRSHRTGARRPSRRHHPPRARPGPDPDRADRVQGRHPAVTLEETSLARQALLAAAGCARRLERSQAMNLNEAYAAVGDLLSAHEVASRYLDERLQKLTGNAPGITG